MDFGLKLLGGDLMAIPGLYGFVQVCCMYLLVEICQDSICWIILSFLTINDHSESVIIYTSLFYNKV